MKKFAMAFLILFGQIAFAHNDVGQQLYESRCAMCHGPDARATGPLAHKSNPPTPDLTTKAFRQRLFEYPGVIISSIVLRPNSSLIPNTLKENGVNVPAHIWTEDELRAVNQYILGLLSKQSAATEKSILDSAPIANVDQSSVIAYVKKAEDYIRKYGKEQAIIEFKKHSVNIFMVDYKGNIYLSPHHPESIGTNQLNSKDSSGVFVIQEDIQKAKTGGGWFHPRLRKNFQTGEYHCREIYIHPMQGNYFIGSWYSYPPDRLGNCSIV